MMKKIFLAMTCMLAIVGCKQKGQTEQNSNQSDSVQADTIESAAYLFSPDEIEVDWTNKEIKVEKGGDQPDIVTLIQAFAQAWPTEVASSLISYANDPKFTEEFNQEIGGCVIANRKNGYAEVTQGDAPGDDLRAAVWKRKDGHRLFMINIFRRKADSFAIEQQALCAYDYNPKTETLTPEQNAVTRFRQTAGKSTFYNLPQQGTNVSIEEMEEDKGNIFHIYAWDGQWFAEANTYDEKEMQQGLNGTWICNEEGNPALTFKMTCDEDHFYAITDCAIYGSTEYEVGDNAFDGFLHVYEIGEGDQEMEQQASNPAIDCKFYLTKDGKLTGTYYLRQNGGKEWRGTMTLEKKSNLSDYAE